MSIQQKLDAWTPTSKLLFIFGLTVVLFPGIPVLLILTLSHLKG